MSEDGSGGSSVSSLDSRSVATDDNNKEAAEDEEAAEETASLPAEPEAPPKWQDSAAKEYLYSLICDGTLPGKDEIKPRQVFDQYCKDRPEFIHFQDYELFKGRLLRLREKAKKRADRAKRDADCLAHDRMIWPAVTMDTKGNDLWQKSKAQELLRKDIEKGEHRKKKPKDLYETQEEYYDNYDLDFFRARIYQERKWFKRQRHKKHKEEEKARKAEEEKEKKAAAVVRKKAVAEKKAAAEAEKERKAEERAAKKAAADEAKRVKAAAMAERKRQAAEKKAAAEAEKKRKAEERAAKKAAADEAKRVKAAATAEKKRQAAEKKAERERKAAAKQGGKKKAVTQNK